MPKIYHICFTNVDTSWTTLETNKSVPFFDIPIVRQKIEGEVLKCRSLASTITQISDKLNTSRVNINIG